MKYGVQGNWIELAIPLTLREIAIVDGKPSAHDTEFIPSPDYPVVVLLSCAAKSYRYEATMEGNIALIADNGVLPCGVYSCEVLCRDGQGMPMRFKKRAALTIVDVTADAGILPDVEFEQGWKILDAAIFIAVRTGGGSAGQTQADWAETDDSDPAFIRNKPTIPDVPTNVSAFENDAGYLTEHQDISGKVDKEVGKGLSTNDYTTAEKQKLAGLSNYNDSALQTAVNNLQTALANVYTKAQTDDAIQEAIDGLGGGSVESVTINGVNHTPDSNGVVDLGTIQGTKGDKGEKGDTVVIDPDGLAQFEIVNDLDTSDPTQGLSARQGKILKQAISTVQANLQAVVDALANMAFTSAKPTLSQIDWTGGTFYAAVVKNLSGCTATDNTTNGQIVEGQTLTMQLTADSGFTLTGATISVTNSKGQSVAYTLNGTTLTVANVTGTITVSVVAVGVFSVVNNDTNVNLTANTMSPTSGSSWTGTLAVKSGISNYRLASAPVVTMGGTAVDFSASGNSWNSTTGVMTIGNVTGNIVITAASVEMVEHRVANHFINMASTGDGYVEDGDDYTAVLSPTTGATSNGDLRVFVDGTPLEATDYTFDSATGALTIPAAKITGDVDVCATASTGKITVTVKAGMSTTVEFKQDQWKAAFYSDTIDASESAEDVTVVIDTVPKKNGIPTVSLWTFGTPAAIKSLDFGGCKTHGTSTRSTFNGFSALESVIGLAYVDSASKAYSNLAQYFKNCSSLRGTLDLMTWYDVTSGTLSNIVGNCTAEEIIMPYMPNRTQMYADLADCKVKRVIFNKTGVITQFRQLFCGATVLEYVDMSRCPVHIGTGMYDWYITENNTTNTFTLKIGVFEMDINPSGGLTHVGKLICTTTTPPGAAILGALSADVQIYVPNNAVDAYKTAWASKASNIHPVSEYTE